MSRFLAVLVFCCMTSQANSASACDDIRAQGDYDNSKKSFWGSFFGRSTSEDESGCESVAPLSVGSDGDAEVYSANDEAIRDLIAEGRIHLEQALEEYRAKTGEDILALGQDISVLKKQSLELKEVLKSYKVSNEKEISSLSKAQLSNRELVEANNSALKLLVDGLSDRLDGVASGLERAEHDLARKVENNRLETSQSVAELDRLVSHNVLYLVIFIVIVLLISTLIFYFLRKKISAQGVDLTGSLSDTRKSLEEEFVKLDGKLVEILEAQIEVSESKPDSSDEDVDHSLVIKVADEIVRIQKNIARMDEKTKGLKQLSASVTRIQDNVSSNGYEIVEMLGVHYSEGLKAAVDFIVDEDLDASEQIITRVIKPQINYQGVMIQSAQIEVSRGE